MSFRMFSDVEIRDSLRERKTREETNKEVSGEAYVKCKNCKGAGSKYYYTWRENNENTIWYREFCDVCGGTGYIDWVEAIIKGTGMII